MKEDSNQCLEKFSCINFEGREFYIPVMSCDIYVKAPLLQIFLWDHDKYVIANGLKCYYSLIYNAQDDTIQTTLKDATIDGNPIAKEGFFPSITYEAKEYLWSEKHPMSVVPKRDYTELTNAFLDESPDLDDSLRHFLLEHPELYNAYRPDQGLNMCRIRWILEDHCIKQAREDPEYRSLLLSYDETIPEKYRFPSWLHDLYVKALGEE